MSVRPFSTGSQYADWTDKNCANCWKAVKSSKRFNCSIEKELGKAYWDNGEIPDEIAARMGATIPCELSHYDPENEVLALCQHHVEQHNRYTWDCPEREQNRPPGARKPKPIVDLIGILKKP
jgi:hypothetical protein